MKAPESWPFSEELWSGFCEAVEAGPTTAAAFVASKVRRFRVSLGAGDYMTVMMMLSEDVSYPGDEVARYEERAPTVDEGVDAVMQVVYPFTTLQGRRSALIAVGRAEQEKGVRN